MPIDTADLKSSYQAQSNINDALLADFNAANPDIIPGARFYDNNGLKWQVINTNTFANGNIMVVVAWVNDADVVTSYQQSMYGIMYETAQFVNTIEFDTVNGQQTYTVADVLGLADLVGGTLLYGDLGAAVLDIVNDLTLNPENGSITFNIPVSGQHCQLIYKRPNIIVPEVIA